MGIKQHKGDVSNSLSKDDSEYFVEPETDPAFAKLFNYSAILQGTIQEVPFEEDGVNRVNDNALVKKMQLDSQVYSDYENKHSKSNSVREKDSMLEDYKYRLTCLFEDVSGENVSPETKYDFLAFAREQLESLTLLPKHGEFNKYPGRVDALKWLMDEWNGYLKCAGANANYIYQDQLRELDPKLVQALHNQIRELNNKGKRGERVKLSDFVPPKEERIKDEAKSLSQEDLRRIRRIHNALQKQSRIEKECRKTNIVNHC